MWLNKFNFHLSKTRSLQETPLQITKNTSLKSIKWLSSIRSVQTNIDCSSSVPFSLKQRNDQKSRNKYKYTKWFGKGLLTLLIPYTGYAIYVTLSTTKEIEYRRQKCDSLISNRGSLRDTEITLIKYSPLQVLGRYENPFVEYRIQTIHEFFFNRIIELFERNRGGIPPDKRQMNKLMPVHKPHWTKSDNSDGNLSMEKDCIINYKILDQQETKTMLSKGKNQNNGGRQPPLENVDKNSIPIYNTWLGQSCNYIEYNDLKILTDPLFSDFLIHETLGPKRITGIPCTIEDIPQPDIILVSHNHPDHLDLKSLNYWKNVDDTLWIIPKGMNKFFMKNNVKNFIELSWWETCQLETQNGNTYNITSTPAMHWSGRSILDTNESLWCSFMLTHKNKPILFHAGDTGYVKDLYVRIKEVFGGGCRLALLPCGQYCPEWHQKPRHINPQEVIKIMHDMDIENVLGVHWGTFVLSGEYFLEPKERLERLAEFKGIRDRCYCPELGRTEKF